MEIEILENGKNELTFKVKNADHTYLNLLRRKLIDMQDVSFAGYNIEHPLVGEAIFIVKTKKGTPMKAVKDAINSAKKEIKELKNLFSKLL